MTTDNIKQNPTEEVEPENGAELEEEKLEGGKRRDRDRPVQRSD